MLTGKTKEGKLMSDKKNRKVWNNLARCLIFYLQGRRKEIDDHIAGLRLAILHDSEEQYKRIRLETEDI